VILIFALFDFPFRSLLSYSPALSLNRAVFFDRDGTLIRDMEYLSRPDGVVLLGGVGDALSRLRAAGFRLIVISNQSGIGRGYFTVADVERVNARVQELLASAGVKFDQIYFAPEVPGVPSRGRKPSPQFLFDARDELHLDLAESYMVGDKVSDLQCGWNAGVKKSILVRTGYRREVEQEEPEAIKAALIVDDLPAAAAWILQNDLVLKKDVKP